MPEKKDKYGGQESIMPWGTPNLVLLPPPPPVSMQKLENNFFEKINFTTVIFLFNPLPHLVIILIIIYFANSILLFVMKPKGIRDMN